MKTYEGVTCRGCYALGTACGKCERCKDQRKMLGVGEPSVSDEIPVFSLTTEVLGLTLRRFYAAHALQGLIARQDKSWNPDSAISHPKFKTYKDFVADEANQYADAMIKAEKDGALRTQALYR